MTKPDATAIVADIVLEAFNAIGIQDITTSIAGRDSALCLAISDHILDRLEDACTITTVEQLEALPIGSVVHTGENLPDSYHEGAWTKNDDGWYWWGMDFAEPASLIGLPALLLYHPDARHS